jgi:hypothetical protein
MTATGRTTEPAFASADTARAMRRLLLVSGWLELCLGTGHNVVATMILKRPDLAAPIVAAMRWPQTILLPISDATQRALVVGMSLGAGTAWMVFGAILIWQGRARAASPDVPLLRLVLLHQSAFAALMVAFVRWHALALAIVVGMVATLWRALALAGRAISWAPACRGPE